MEEEESRKGFDGNRQNNGLIEDEESRKDIDGKPKPNRKKKKNKVSYIIRRFGCMIVDEESPAAAATGGLSRDLMATHLIVMVNGILGSSKDWSFAAKQFLKRYPDHILVHCSEVNYARLTLDGIDVMGNRLAEEVMSVVARHPSIRKISFIGHSLGGLISRYAVALLYKQGSADQNSGQKLCGSIAGLEPVNFITAATPHLGSRGHKQIPMFCGTYAFEKAASQVSKLFGMTGYHLFLWDAEPPLLLKMSRDCDDLKYISALRLFRKRVVYANTRYDHIVGWSSSSVRRMNELPKLTNLKRNTKYPHVVNEEFSTPNAEAAPLDAELPDEPIKAIEEMMIRGLNQLSWHRVDISFNGGIQRLVAHTSIQVQNRLLHAKGVDVIQHMIDNFDI